MIVAILINCLLNFQQNNRELFEESAIRIYLGGMIAECKNSVEFLA